MERQRSCILQIVIGVEQVAVYAGLPEIGDLLREVVNIGEPCAAIGIGTDFVQSQPEV